MKKIITLLLAVTSVFFVSVTPFVTTQAIGIDNAKNITKEESCKNVKNCNSGSALTSIFQTVANIALFLVGAVAVIMLIIGGFRYVMSNGDPNITKGARDTILYAIIGIVVAFLAYAGVNFVVTSLTSGAS